ncbi:hypothetical protein THF5G08_70234 [Vibrio jasicida]|nr:hypothetical protein THF5G08_70234 [Vibrio jasicida]
MCRSLYPRKYCVLVVAYVMGLLLYAYFVFSLLWRSGSHTKILLIN